MSKLDQIRVYAAISRMGVLCFNNIPPDLPPGTHTIVIDSFTELENRIMHLGPASKPMKHGPRKRKDWMK